MVQQIISTIFPNSYWVQKLEFNVEFLKHKQQIYTKRLKSVHCLDERKKKITH